MYPDHLSNWGALAAEFRRRGYFTPNTRRIAGELCVHVSLLFLGTFVYLASDGFWPRVSGAVVSALGSLGIATNAHTASHSCSHSKAYVNRAITYFGYSFALGLSATYWHHKHALHHAHPNILGLDEDLEFRPFFAIHTEALRSARGFRRFYYAHQWLIAPMAISLNAFNIQRQGWKHVLDELLRVRAHRAAALRADLLCSIAHVLVFIVAASLVFGVTAALSLYVIRSVLLSYAVFALFVPAHWPAEARCASDTLHELSFGARQTYTTLNFRLPKIVAFFASGLSHQIEHHLFPRIDHTHYGAMSSDVKAFCERHALPYRCLSFNKAVRDSLLVFRHPKIVRPTLVSTETGGCRERT